MAWKELIDWSHQNFSHLPWRKNRTLYTTLVSEVMLQQTTVPTVLGKFEEFIAQFPHYSILAESSEEQIQIAWKGLGYYRRAKNLRMACIRIAKDFDSTIPLEKSQLLSIPGVGDYTANALLAIGANRPALALDANLERILARLWGLGLAKGNELKKILKEKYDKGDFDFIIQEYGARAFHESLMDLGRTYCQQRKVDCQNCPLSDLCIAHKKGIALSIPRIEVASKKFYRLHLLRIVVECDGRFLMYKKPQKRWLEGQYEMPSLVLSCEDGALRQYPFCPPRLKDCKPLVQFSTTITKYKIINDVICMGPEQFTLLFGQTFGLQWIKTDANVATSVLKTIKAIDEFRVK